MQQQELVEKITEVNIGLETTPAVMLRQLRVEETKARTQTLFVGALGMGSLQPYLRTREIRAYVAPESKDVLLRGWVEAKSTEEDMEATITVAARSVMTKRQAREVSYPQAGGRSENHEEEEMIVQWSQEPVDTVQN